MIIEGLTTVLEKLTDLLKHRESRREKRFTTLVVPVYNDLEKIHADYLAMFASCKQLIASGASLDNVAVELMGKRLHCEPVRRAIMTICESLSADSKHKDFREFFSNVLRYFENGSLRGGTTPANMLLHAMQHWVADQNGRAILRAWRSQTLGDPREVVTEVIESTLERIRRGWDQVALSYSRALSSATP